MIRNAPIRVRSNFSVCLRISMVACVLFAPLGSNIVLRGKEIPRPNTEDSINLPKMTVKGTAVCSFGISIGWTRDPVTRTIKRVIITDVLPESLADKSGLKKGDEILAVNGRKVAGLDGGIAHGAWFFDQLVDREPGQSIDVEVEVRVVKNVKLRAYRATETVPPK